MEQDNIQEAILQDELIDKFIRKQDDARRERSFQDKPSQ